MEDTEVIFFVLVGFKESRVRVFFNFGKGFYRFILMVFWLFFYYFFLVIVIKGFSVIVRIRSCRDIESIVFFYNFIL